MMRIWQIVLVTTCLRILLVSKMYKSFMGRLLSQASFTMDVNTASIHLSHRMQLQALTDNVAKVDRLNYASVFYEEVMNSIIFFWDVVTVL